jgi:hypothetical protein
MLCSLTSQPRQPLLRNLDVPQVLHVLFPRTASLMSMQQLLLALLETVEAPAPDMLLRFRQKCAACLASHLRLRWQTAIDVPFAEIVSHVDSKESSLLDSTGLFSPSICTLDRTAPSIVRFGYLTCEAWADEMHRASPSPADHLKPMMRCECK